ncbi:MAG: alpha/beta hydrolase [Bacteroidota bacterium]
MLNTTTVFEEKVVNGILMLFFLFLPYNLNSMSVNICDSVKNLVPDDNFRCGVLMVPEDHDIENGKKISIAYLVLKSTSNITSNDPLVHVSGGPGLAQLFASNIEYWSSHPVREKRDIILFDQRGIGFSSPLPSFKDEYLEIMASNISPDKEERLVKYLLKGYKNQCDKKGIKLENYNTYYNAKDIGLLLHELGYQKYNIYGVSYGTVLGRLVQDLYPNYLNTVIYNSPKLFGEDMLTDRLKSYSDALELVFEYFEKEYDSNSFDLRKKYFEALDSIDIKPIKITHQGKDFFINAHDAIYLLRRKLYAPDSRNALPALIKELIEGRGPILKELISGESNLTSVFNYSMWLAIERSDFFEKNASVEANVVHESFPLVPFRMGFFSAMYYGVKDWFNPKIAMEKKEFKLSSIPTLITVKRYDPITPPSNGLTYKEKIPGAHLFILDESGHAGNYGPCENEIIISFMDNPQQRLNTSCLNLWKD